MKWKYRIIENEFGGLEHQIKKWYYIFWKTFIPERINNEKTEKMMWMCEEKYNNWVKLGKPNSKKIIKIIHPITKK